MDSELEVLVKGGINYALSSIKKHYEESPNEEDNLPFHIRQHTIEVIRRTARLACAMRLPKKEVLLAKLAAAFHDAVVRWNIRIPSPDVEIHRNANNEFNSAAFLINWLNWVDPQKSIINAKDRYLLIEAIMATVTAWDAKCGTSIQPGLGHDSHPVMRCVALADLGTAGMDGKLFLLDSDLRFFERNLDIEITIRHAKKRNYISRNVQQGFKKRILDWLFLQEYFVKGRRMRLEFELGDLGPEEKKRVRKLFRCFNQTEVIVEEAIAKRKDQDFWFIAKEMGYPVPSE